MTLRYLVGRARRSTLTALTITPLLVGAPAIAQQAARATAADTRTTAPTKIRVTGRVLDRQNAVPLPGVPVELVGSTTVVYTDVDGRYVIDVPAGAHVLKVAMAGYDERTINVDAQSGSTVTVDVGLSMAGFAEEVTVQADVTDGNSSTAEAQLLDRKRSAVVSDNIGAEEMKDNNDNNAASGLSRVTGLSVVGDGYVFVRGLGERYSSTTLGGVSLPTTEPERRVVSLDLFPAGLIDNVKVAKTYSVDQSAEFAGGLVQIEPLKFPSRPVVDLSYGIGFNNQTTFEDIRGYQGGSNDFWGFGKNARALPGTIPDSRVIRGAGRFTPDVGFTQPQLQQYGQSFSNNWSLLPRNGDPNQTFGAVYGDRFGKLGVVASFSQNYREQFYTDKQITYVIGENDALENFVDYDFDYSTTRSQMGVVANVAYQLAPTQRLSFENFLTNTGEDEARFYQGFNGEANRYQRSQRLFWVEERLSTSNLSGNHFFSSLGNSRFDWRVGYGTGKRDEPDIRETTYQAINPANPFEFADLSQSGFRMFNTLDDTTVDGQVNWSLLSNVKGRPLQFKTGFAYLDRQRDFQSRRFRFVPLNLTGLDLTAPPETLFAPANISPNRFELKEETRTTDAYDATQQVAAGYGMVDFSATARLRLIGGLRVESFQQEVNTRDLFSLSFDPEVITSNLDETNLFPSLNVVYALTPSSNLRAGISQTANRPEFRELAPFEFTDVIGGRSSVGNPDLQQAIIQNVDVRYEVFPRAEEVFAVSFFYKNFDNPIERVLEPTANIRTSYDNADSARNVGIELEARKRLTDWFFVGANYSYIDSSVTLTEAAAQVQTSLERPLAGQSNNLVNLLAEVRFGATSSFRVLYNYVGDRITDVGASGLPDIIQEGRNQLDLVYAQRVFRKLTVRASLDNLTNDPWEFTQGGLRQRYYDLGRTFSLNFSFSAF
jgi:outer membrane receptor protein involved in Fe transport